MLSTSAEEEFFAVALSIVRRDRKISCFPKGTTILQWEDWHNSINILNDYASYSGNFTRMLEPFKSMWIGHLEHTTATNDSVELDPPETTSIHYITYRVGPKARALGKSGIDNMLSMNI